MRSRPIVPWIILLITGCLLCPNASVFAQSDEEILVLVNQAPITRKDLRMEMALLDAEMDQRNNMLSDHQMAKLSRKLVDNLIQRELLHQKAREKKIAVYSRLVKQALDEFKARLRTRSSYLDYLRKARLDENQLRARIKKGLAVRALLRKDVVNRIKVSEAEMQAFYRTNPDFFQNEEQFRFRQIMISIKKRNNPSQRGNALLRIQAIQNKLMQGDNFSALALEYSEDNSRYNGGDLGYLERGQIIGPLADVAFDLKPGQVSDIIETHLGYHLIQLVDKMPPKQMAYRNAREKIERTIRREKENRATNSYMAGLKRQASIKRMASY